MDLMLAPWTVLSGSQQSLSSSGKAKPDSTPAAVPAAVVTNDVDTAARCDLVNLMNIPKVEIDVYDGNPVDYRASQSILWGHWQQTWLLSSKTYKILQYTTGAAKSAIKNCALVSGESGHKQAQDILRNRFGNKHIITQTIISQLKTGKRVTKPQWVATISRWSWYDRGCVGKFG